MAKMNFTDYGQAASPAFMGDLNDREHILPGGAQLDATSMLSADSVTIHNTAVAAADATSIAVSALPVAIPAGTKLTFTGGKVAYVSADAAAAATSLSVYALAAEIDDESDATYDPANANMIVPAGTLVGRTNAEKLAGAKFGAAADADDEVFIVAEEVDLASTPDCNLVRHGSLIKFNFLPSWDGASSTVKGKMHSMYQLIKG